MQLAIVGPGGVGGYFGGRLAEAGNDVTFLARGAHLAAMQANGLRIESPAGAARIRVRATDDPAAVGPVDLVLLTVKRYDVEATLPQIRPLVGPQTLVVPFQNGVDMIAELTTAFGAAHAAGGTAHITAAVVEPGVIRHTALDRLIVGMPDGAEDPRLVWLRNAGRAAGFDAVLSPRIAVEIWMKFTRLTVFSGMTAICRTSIGPIRRDPALRRLMADAWRESMAVAQAHGIALPSDMFDQMQSTIDQLPDEARSSMLGDLERGRRLELPWLSGAMVRLAEAVGVDVPTHRLFVALLGPHVRGRAGA